LKARIYIDGAAGTTGLEIRDRLSSRKDIELLCIADRERKDQAARARLLNESDIAVLCLPDEAAREAMAGIKNPDVRILDASTAHRTAQGWVYGFPELEPDQRTSLRYASRVSNPGCYPTGFLALVRPLVRSGLIPPDFPLTAHAVSGYSGGGRPMIEEFENESSPRFTRSIFRNYALGVSHKHIPEMQKHAGLAHPPLFAPAVGRFYRGMIVEVPLQLWALPRQPSPAAIRDVLAEAYAQEPLIDAEPPEESRVTMDAEMLKGSDRMKLFVFGNEQTRQARLVAVLDNLGKGASGAAVQNLNIMLGLPEAAGLR
jgi:N-acetyl-gamma-glutamyl-phosphate reductase